VLVIVYDCTDRPDLGYRSPTMRIVGQDGTLMLQGVLPSSDGRQLAERIAAGLGVPCEWIGPPAKKPDTAQDAQADLRRKSNEASAAVPGDSRAGFLFAME